MLVGDGEEEACSGFLWIKDAIKLGEVSRNPSTHSDTGKGKEAPLDDQNGKAALWPKMGTRALPRVRAQKRRDEGSGEVREVKETIRGLRWPFIGVGAMNSRGAPVSAGDVFGA